MVPRGSCKAKQGDLETGWLLRGLLYTVDVYSLFFSVCVLKKREIGRVSLVKQFLCSIPVLC